MTVSKVTDWIKARGFTIWVLLLIASMVVSSEHPDLGWLFTFTFFTPIVLIWLKPDSWSKPAVIEKGKEVGTALIFYPMFLLTFVGGLSWMQSCFARPGESVGFSQPWLISSLALGLIPAYVSFWRIHPYPPRLDLDRYLLPTEGEFMYFSLKICPLFPIGGVLALILGYSHGEVWILTMPAFSACLATFIGIGALEKLYIFVTTRRYRRLWHG